MSATSSASKKPRTVGVHHVGLAVSDLQASRDFFVNALGFNEVAEDKEYPAFFVSDGTNLITLWQVKDPATATPFDRRGNVGLHHLALRVPSEEALAELHEELQAADGVKIETPPEQLGSSPHRHMFVYDPSGVRIELIHWSS